MLFIDSPFSPVADQTIAACWSGHKQIRDSVTRLHDSLLKRSDQSLDVLWANLGAGKTHTLFHLQYLFQLSNDRQKVICSFVEVPETIRGFLDLYRAIARSLPLRDVFVEIRKQGAVLGSDLAKAANVILDGGPREQGVVVDWLYGGRPYLVELRSCSGIGKRIEDDRTATEAMAGIIKALAASKVRLVLLFDEFQRMGNLPETTRTRTLSSLRTLFSRSPKYFSAVFAVQSMVEESALKLIPPELKTLIGRKPTISLPELNLDEAEEFVLGRFDFFRPDGYKDERSLPFGKSAVRSVLEYLAQKKGVKLIPREILLALGFICDSVGDPDREISLQQAVAALRTYGA